MVLTDTKKQIHVSIWTGIRFCKYIFQRLAYRHHVCSSGKQIQRVNFPKCLCIISLSMKTCTSKYFHILFILINLHVLFISFLSNYCMGKKSLIQKLLAIVQWWCQRVLLVSLCEGGRCEDVWVSGSSESIDYLLRHSGSPHEARLSLSI